MPGSPPISTSDPCTSPPPSTRFSSASCRSMRGSSAASISSSVTGFAFVGAMPASGRRATGSLRTISSTKVFHCPHAGHFPCHLGDSCPQLLHTYTVFSLAISERLKKIVASKIVQTGRSTKRKHSFRLFRPSLVWLYLASFPLSVVPIVDGHLLFFLCICFRFHSFSRRTPPGPASVVVSVIDAVKILLLFVRSKIWPSVIAKNLLIKTLFCVNKTNALVSSVESDVFALAGRRFLFVTLSLCVFMDGMHLVCE